MAKFRARKARNRLMLRQPCALCCFCGDVLRFRETTLEHVVPQSVGGTNHPSNLRLSCVTCNNGRGDLDYLTFRNLVLAYGQEQAVELAKGIFSRQSREALCIRWHID